MGKNILAVIVGLLCSFIVIIFFESIGHIIHPPPANLNINNTEELKAFVSSAPAIVFVMVILAYAIGSIVGGIVTARMAPTNKLANAITLGGVLMGLGAYNLFMLPHPIWTIVISLFVFIPCSYLGGNIGIKLSGKKK